MDQTETKLIASALYQIRLLLSSYIGPEVDAPVDVRLAAHIAYALHNEALALVEGASFDVQAALKKVAAIDSILGTDDSKLLAQSWSAIAKENV